MRKCAYAISASQRNVLTSTALQTSLIYHKSSSLSSMLMVSRSCRMTTGRILKATEIQASGFAPPQASQSAIIITRPAGNTTAIVSGKNATTGNTPVEVYTLPQLLIFRSDSMRKLQGVCVRPQSNRLSSRKTAYNYLQSF